jgi:hypothetical protein
MLGRTGRLTRIAGALALIFAIFSAGVAIANQCHQEAAPVISSHSHADHDGSHVHAEVVPLNQSLTTTFCASVFFIVLILISRQILSKVGRGSSLRARTLQNLQQRIYYQRRWLSSLTLPQLGVLRI